MDEYYDRFSNAKIAELYGKIPRTPFDFKYQKIEVWQNQTCILSSHSNGVINAKIVNNNLIITFNEEKVKPYIKSTSLYNEILMTNTRIMWTKDVLNMSNKGEYLVPDVACLFYKNGVLAKVAFTIFNPGFMVEFYI